MPFRLTSIAICTSWLLAMHATAEEQQLTITQAFERTKSARTVDDFSKIISACEQARSEPLSARMAKYVPELLSWSLNRRGELFVAEAADLIAAGERERAIELDDKARADFDRAVELNAEAWKPLHNRGLSRALRGEVSAAIDDFTRVVQLKPDYVDAWFNRAELRFDAGEVEAAVADYTRAIELRDDDAIAYVKRAGAYLHLGDLDAARTDCQLAIKLDPQSAAAYARRGQVHERRGAWDAAADDFRTAVGNDPESLTAYQAAGWLMATCPDPAFRQRELAVQVADKALELSRGQPDWRTLDVVAAAYANAGRYSEATVMLERALPLAPGAQRGPLQQRLALYRAGKPFRQAIAITAATGEAVSR